MESYSLWLLPPKSITREIRELQTRCRDVLGGPKIMPHITIAGGILTQKNNFLDTCRDLLPSIVGAHVKSEGIGIDQLFFRSIFLKVSVDDKIRAARRSLYNSFDVIAPHYCPHSSLFYGHADDWVKTEIVETFQPVPFAFKATKFALASNDEENLRWRILHTFSL